MQKKRDPSTPLRGGANGNSHVAGLYHAAPVCVKIRCAEQADWRQVFPLRNQSKISGNRTPGAEADPPSFQFKIGRLVPLGALPFRRDERLGGSTASAYSQICSAVSKNRSCTPRSSYSQASVLYARQISGRSR